MSEEQHHVGDSVRTLGIFLLAGLTLVAAASLALLWGISWLVRHAAEASTLDDVERAAWATPLFWLAIVLLCLPWIFVWRKKEWDFGCLPIVIAAVALLISAFFFVRVITVERTLTITTWACDAGYSPFTSGNSRITDGCTRASIPGTISFGTAEDPGKFTAVATGDARFEVSGLPEGYYHAHMTATAPLETASVIVVGERQRMARTPHTLRVDDPAAGEGRTWSGSSHLPSEEDALAFLYYPSAQPAQENATITFEVQECSGTPATFDPANCSPAQRDAPLMSIYGPQGDLQAHREPVVTREGHTMTWDNLEARTYIFRPGSPGAFFFRQDNQFLAIPKEEPQIADADELERLDNGDEVLSVEISPESGTITYMIYIFPTSTDIIAMVP